MLAFDTSAAHVEAALLRGGRITADVSVPMVRGQAEALLPVLEGVLAGAGLGWRDLDGIGAGCGPGNFTGLRITVAAARGLAMSLSIPAVPVTTFEALAWGLSGPVTATVAAPQDRLYVAHGEEGVFGPPVLCTLDALGPPGPEGRLCVGHRAEEVARQLGGRVAAAAMPLAPAIAARAAHVLATGGPFPRPSPVYVRAADAAPARDGPPPRLP